MVVAGLVATPMVVGWVATTLCASNPSMLVTENVCRFPHQKHAPWCVACRTSDTPRTPTATEHATPSAKGCISGADRGHREEHYQPPACKHSSVTTEPPARGTRGGGEGDRPAAGARRSPQNHREDGATPSHPWTGGEWGGRGGRVWGGGGYPSCFSTQPVPNHPEARRGKGGAGHAC